MRLTYTDLRANHYSSINLSKQDGTPDTDAKTDRDFNIYLGQRYQLMLAKMNNYKTVKPYTFSTASNTTLYPFPPGLVTIEGGYITVGSVNYPLTPVTSRFHIEQLNAIQIQASALPQFYFVEQDSFQIWPIPQTTYTGKIYYHFRDRNLSVEDYTTGTITLTNDSSSVTISGGTFTAAMVGRWLTVTDTTVPGQGYWYRIVGYTNSSTITLGANDGTPVKWNNATASGVTFRIGETPEMPEEMHILLNAGALADYYRYVRKDLKNAMLLDNLFWTGDEANNSRDWTDTKIAGGLIGGINSYKDRDNRTIIRRRPNLNPLQYKVFATRLSLT